MTETTETTISNYLCIGCPLGCRLEVEEENSNIVEVRGFSCKRGEEYAKQEHIEPRRMVTTTVRVSNGIWAKLPVKTTAAIPKEKVLELCQKLRQVNVTAPIHIGDTILSNVLNLGIDVVASRDMPMAQN